RRTKNLTLPEARPIKKVLALALRSLADLPADSIPIARCALLNTGQWALNGRSQQPNLKEFRTRLRTTVHEMIEASAALGTALGGNGCTPFLINDSAAALDTYKPFSEGTRARLVVTS